MNTENPRASAAAEAAWGKVRENVARRSNALEEIKKHFGVLLELRDRKIAELERKLALAPIRSDIDFEGESRLGLKLLVVEGSVTTRKSLVSALRRRFYVSSAGDGYAALQLMADKPDMILTGLNLAYVDAIRMIGHMRQIAKEVQIVVVLDSKGNCLVSQLQALGVETFIRKPYRLDDLVEKMEAVARTCAPYPMKSVLAVCPNAHERRALYALLEDQYRTVVAASAAAALEMTGARPDVLIVDAAAGDVSWEQMVMTFRKAREDLKVLALCEVHNATVVGASEAGPIHDVVVRPYCFEDLGARTKRLLGIEHMTGFLRKVFRQIS